jgi:tRNA (Thr-GGU) A37 N-methylase
VSASAQTTGGFELRPIGVVRAGLTSTAAAQRQSGEGAPGAWVEVSAFANDALEGLAGERRF